MSLVVLEDVSLAFGEQIILDHVGLRISDRDRIGLIGPNGSGKTTLLRIIADEQSADSGAIQRAKGVRVGYLPQDISMAGGRGLLDFVLSSVPGRLDLDRELAEAEARLEESRDEGELMATAARVAELHERIDHHEQFYAEHQAHRILAGLGFRPRDRERDLSEFSGGWKMRAVLASLLFQQPDLLLMDEPTNHLDMPSVAWLSGFLARYNRAFVLISHDREFLNEQIGRVVSFEAEGLRQYTGNVERYAELRAAEEILLENKSRNQARERERMERFVERFRAKATKARQAQSRAKQLARMEEVEVLQLRKTMRIKFAPVARTVNDVVKIEGLKKAFGDLVVFDGIDLKIQRGEKIGIIGANGVGKTTLLKMIAGELASDGGEIAIGSNVKLAYFAQHHADTLHADSTVLEEVSRANPDALPARVRSVLGAFLFSGDDVDKPIRVLSGGERARVALARILINPGSLLLMDEPTNHLDLHSSEALAESLKAFTGTCVFVSHNRSLVRGLATRIWNIEDGEVETYPGTLDEYMESCRLRLESADASAFSKPAPDQRAQTKPADEKPAKRTSPASDKARRRREAEERRKRAQLLNPIKKRIDRLEQRIAKLEEQQKERSARLSDPAVYDDASRRNQLLSDYQKADDKLAELNGRWEVAASELEAAEARLADSGE